MICIGPVCIPATALMPIVLWLLKPIWVRLPPQMQDAMRSRFKSFQQFMQAKVWDRIGWKAKAPKEKVDAPTSDACGLEASMGSVVGMHSEADFAAAMQLTREKDVILVVDYTAVWCGPCQRIAPFFSELANKHASRALFVKVDVDELEEVSHASPHLCVAATERGAARCHKSRGVPMSAWAACERVPPPTGSGLAGSRRDGDAYLPGLQKRHQGGRDHWRQRVQTCRHDRQARECMNLVSKRGEHRGSR